MPARRHDSAAIALRSLAANRSLPGLLLPVVLAAVLIATTIATRAGASEATIDGQHQGTGPIGAGQMLELQVGGRAGVPLDAAAVVLNVTAVAPSGPGHVTAYPCDQQRPLASNLNYTAGDVVANLVIAKPDAAGRVCLYSHAASDFVADVAGYFPAGSAYQPVTNPARLLETRVGRSDRTIDGRFQGIEAVGGGAELQLDVADRAGVPGDAAAVVLNVTAVSPSGPGHVTAYPCDQERPLASNLNYAAGDVVANVVIAKPDVSGRVCLYSHATSDFVADVAGYFPAGSGYRPITNPARLLDTRPGRTRTVDGEASGGGVVAGGTSATLRVTNRAGVPAGASAVALNVVAVAPHGAGHVTVFPCSETQPLASNLNYAPGDVVANMVIAKPDASGNVCLYTHATADLVADVAGYFPAGSDYVPIANPARLLETRSPAPAGGHGGHGGAPGAEPGATYGIPAFTEAEFLPRRSGRGDLRLTECGASWSQGTSKYPGCTPRDSADGPFNGIGTFRVFCDYTHMGYDDPIVFPGQVDASHLHLFFGNTTTDENSNLNGMRNVGNSTCDGGIADRSAYWVPALYDPSEQEIIEPWIFAAYYQSGFSGLDPASIQPIPEGLRMIIGKASATPATYSSFNTGFGFGGRWGCFNGGGGPTSTGGDIPDCGDQRVTLVLNFPQCWDGVNLDSPDHISHMAQASFRFSGGSAVRECPATHPVALPSIMLQVVYGTNGTDSDNWRLVSDMYPTTEEGGASLHADFVNGWDPAIMNLWLNNCVRAVKDCERSELGNGQALASRFFR